MHSFTALLRQFGEKGEKTGWTYINVPNAITETLRPGRKTSFRVKGVLDAHGIERVALIPMGSSETPDSQFIMAINATMRRAIRKEAGATVRVELAVDDSPLPPSADLVVCLQDDPTALAFFQTLTNGHQLYFNNWIEAAKTVETRTRRLTQAITGLAMGMSYSEMIRYNKRKKAE